jgi:outer membrane protein OmpA-like peptidoglycan-associated protein
MTKNKGFKKIYWGLLDTALLAFVQFSPVFAIAPEPNVLIPYRVIVNSDRDGPIQADNEITLREAIEIVNNTLLFNELSIVEKAQVQQLAPDRVSNIEFALPFGQTTIRLQEVLPPLVATGLVIDGTTNPGYEANKSTTAEIAIATPVVAITPAENTKVFRGLTIVADNIVVRGLSIYGFSAEHKVTEVTPPADIFIAHRLTVTRDDKNKLRIANFETIEDALAATYTSNRGIPTQNVVIENNWLGISPDESIGQVNSAFGVSVFNSSNTKIYRNRIYNHDGSAIITSVRANNMDVRENIIVANGLAGMPDGIRLDGIVRDSTIEGNLICGNDGSGVFLFKPDGGVTINNNDIKFNGRRLRRAAVYVMGNDNKVINNKITDQTGPGVVVSAYHQSDLLPSSSASYRNIIEDNTFANLEGLSIDLNTRRHVEVQDWQIGDGPNAPRDTYNRQLDTGNKAIETPQFLSDEFVLLNGKVNIDGLADPGSQITLYKLGNASTSYRSVKGYAPLKEEIATTTVDDQGKFGFTLTNLEAGDTISAIATREDLGTSEPAYNAIVRSLNGSTVIDSQVNLSNTEKPICTTTPEPPPTPTPTPTPEVPPEIPPEPIRIKVPRKVHFALDKSYISARTAKVLDRVAAVLKEYPYIVIELAGHTDIRASVQYNIALSRRRSLSVRDYLRRKGVDPARMIIRYYGESKLEEQGRGVIDHALNRRVEIQYRDVRGVELIIEEEISDLQPER